jgi:hypothetical protein
MFLFYFLAFSSKMLEKRRVEQVLPAEGGWRGSGTSGSGEVMGKWVGG